MSDGFLDDDAWAWATAHLPIVCVDVLPVRGAEVGLISRRSPMGPRWCHVGGRVLLGETLHDAARRHLATTIASDPDPVLREEPFTVVQYFTDERPGFGHDPRKHAVATCFLADVVGDVEHVPGEAEDLAWFTLDALPDDLWPGADLMIAAARKHLT